MANILSGLSLGALTGLLLGLSASPVVGSVLGSLIAGIMVFLSLSDTDAQAPRMDRSKLSRLTSFSLSTIVVLLIGIGARSGEWLGRSEIQRKYDDLLQIGFDESKARELVAESLTSSDSELERARSPVLWSSKGSRSGCADLDPAVYTDDESILQAYASAGLPWSDLTKPTDVNKSSPLRERAQALYDALCR